MIFSRLPSLFVLVRGRGYSLVLLYVLVIGSTAMESIGIASIYPLAKMFQDASQLDYYRDKLIVWVPALEFLSREQFFSYSLLGVGALFVFKNVFLVLAGYGNISLVTHLYRSWMNQISVPFLSSAGFQTSWASTWLGFSFGGSSRQDSAFSNPGNT